MRILNPFKRSPKPDCVLITQGKMTKMLSWWCPFCNEPHSIAVRPLGGKISIYFREPYWPWNGSTNYPTIMGETCIALHCGHHYIQNGILSQYASCKKRKLIPVHKWPLKPTQPTLQYKIYQLAVKKPLNAAKHALEAIGDFFLMR